MELSMWIIKDRLEKFELKYQINSGEMNIKNVRYFSGTSIRESDYIYVGYAKEFIDTDIYNVICVNKEDMILIKADNIYEVFNELLFIFEYYNKWEEEIKDLISRDEQIKTVLEKSQGIFNHPILITDASHYVIGINYPEGYKKDEYSESYSLPVEALSIINDELKENMFKSESYLFKTKAFRNKAVIRNFFAKGLFVGWFIVLDVVDDDNINSLSQLANVFGSLVESWFLNNSDKMFYSSQAALFLEILEGEEDREKLLFKLKGIGWNEEDENLVVKIDSLSDDKSLTLPILNRILPQIFSGCYAVYYRSNLVLVANLRIISETKLKETLKDVLKRSKSFCGFSYRFTDISKLLIYYKQAEIALEYGVKIPGTINTCEEFAMEYLKNIISESLSVNISHPALEKLYLYDKENNTEYYKTLEQYLINERNQAKTAELLNMHRNTLAYRIKRIEEITGGDLNDTALRQYLIMSYFISSKNQRI